MFKNTTLFMWFPEAIIYGHVLIPFDPIIYFFIGKIIIEYLIITAIYNVFIRLTRTFIYKNINGSH